ncbi:hypothetical protein KM043_018443 [Ampulex compressa]|nr:hypothetical protein KM043_018443 [Ampulex compressa]
MNVNVPLGIRLFVKKLMDDIRAFWINRRADGPPPPKRIESIQWNIYVRPLSKLPERLYERSQLKNLVLPMPPDCEISWGEHRPSIKGRNVFGQMLNSSSKHHTGNMKLFLLIVLCVAVALAAPSEKKKREILPGDPRYGTEHHHDHHHHENEVPQTSYGPPNYKPPAPLNNAYLTPAINAAKQPSPAPIYGSPSTHATQQVSNTYLQPAIQDVKQSSVPSTNYGVPVQSVKSAHVSHEAKTETVPSVRVQTSQPVVEQHRVEEIKTYTTPEVKAVVQAPVSQGLVHAESTDFKSGDFGASQTFLGGSLGSNDFGSFGSVGGGFSELPSLQSSGFPKLGGSSDFSGSLSSGASLGSSLYTGTAAYGAPPSFDSSFSGYNPGYQFGSVNSGLRAVDQGVHVQVPQYPVQITKHVPFPVPVPHTVEVPKPYFVHVPQPVPVQHTVPYPVPQYIQPQSHQAVEKGNPVYDFFQNNLGSLQNPFQNVQLPSFQVPFLKPTSSPTVVDVPAEKFNVGAHVEADSVAVENPQVKSAPVKSTSTTFTHAATSLKATKEYTQPIDSNGGYVY